MVKIGAIEIKNTSPFVLISGPCQIESRDHALMMADALKTIAVRLSIPLIYKSSFDKANRTSLMSARGVGMDEGLRILEEVKASLELPVITDIHAPEQAAPVAEVVDLLQIPAFLSRQTDLLVAAAKTNKPVMVKKGQFLAPEDMRYVVEKIVESGNENTLVCERGASFGYHNLVVDMRGLDVMKAYAPVVFDATHSVQAPGGLAGQSGGAREFAPVLARAALGVGVAAIFAECHQDPNNAPSDGPVMLRLDEMEKHLKSWKAIDDVVKSMAQA